MTALISSKTAGVTVADDPRWAQIVARDRSADGRFWYSVATTRNLLPSVLSVANRQSKERAIARYAQGREGDRFPALQAV